MKMSILHIHIPVSFLSVSHFFTKTSDISILGHVYMYTSRLYYINQNGEYFSD